MQTQPATPIRPLREMVRSYVEGVIREHPSKPQYLIAVELGLSPTTLIRMRKRWAGTDESVLKDRR